MRLIATFAAVATVNATFFEDTNDVLSRSRRVAADEDDQCAEGEVMNQDGFCFDSTEAMLDIMGPVDEDETPGLQAKRKFQMGPNDEEQEDSSNDAEERTKRRSQRITLLVTKASIEGKLVDRNGNKLRAKQFMAMVNNYGCHCWPNNRGKEHLTGVGQPLDPVDEVCFDLKDCHKCIGIDFPYDEQDRPKGCDPVTTKYKAKLNRSADKLEIECTNTLNKKGTNNGDCKRSLCECDKAFAEKFANAFASYDKGLWNLADDSVAYENQCHRPGNAPERSLKGDKECCGAYPERKSFNPANRQCDNINGIVPIGN